jgi:hypothetical protein
LASAAQAKNIAMRYDAIYRMENAIFSSNSHCASPLCLQQTFCCCCQEEQSSQLASASFSLQAADMLLQAK